MDYSSPPETAADYSVLPHATDTADNMQTTEDYFSLLQATADYCRPRKTVTSYHILMYTTATTDKRRLLRTTSACRRLPQTTADQGKMPETTIYWRYYCYCREPQTAPTAGEYCRLPQTTSACRSLPQTTADH